jgi:16S rRNA (guanine966-N2)-methyltransferase
MPRGLRVVAGAAGGRRLVAPKRNARPTADRVKEALFNVLGDRVDGAEVLDLYAGSGALGIEALSRGAHHAVFVDQDQSAVVAIRANLRATGLAAAASVRRMTSRAFVAAGPPARAFDLVLADPPYDTPAREVGHVLDVLAAPGWVAADGAVVVERGADESVALPGGWETRFSRRYGDTLLVVAGP